MIVGLTGGIGSGKSAAANHFISHGITVIDADDLAKEVLQVNTHGYKEVIHNFGSSILDQSNSIDRSKLRIEVFNNPDKKKTTRIHHSPAHSRADGIENYVISIHLHNSDCPPYL